MKHFLTSLVVLMSCASAQAEFLIDDFTTGFATLGFSGAVVTQGPIAVVSGTRTTTVSPGTQIVFGLNSFTFNGLGAGAAVNLLYTLSAPLNLTSSGVPTLGLAIANSAGGAFNFDVTLNPSGTPFAFPTVAVVPPGGTVSFDGDTAPPAVASAVTSISITITQTAPVGFGTLNTPTPLAKISANPEPASLALLGMTGLGGWFMARRRGKKSEVAA